MGGCDVIGGRYDQQPEGLHISNITSSDEGTYYCQALVESSGVFKEQTVTLQLLGISVCHTVVPYVHTNYKIR